MTDETIEFRAWPKIARLNRDIIVTEKIDGTNAAVGVTEDGRVYAQSRKRIITPEQDNFGFAAFVREHEDFLRHMLGPGLHFGEWWGQGIQRGYGLSYRVFSLFNVKRWREIFPATSYDARIRTVPILWEGMFDTRIIRERMEDLRETGSFAVPGFMKPEGIVVYHTAANTLFKATLDRDEEPKSRTR